MRVSRLAWAVMVLGAGKYMMKRVLRVLLASLPLLGLGCAMPFQEPLPEILQPTEGLTEGFIGLTETQARALARSRNVPFRVVQRDGKDLAVTFDFRRGRINAQVRENVVFAYTVEGEPGEKVQKPQNEDRPNSGTNIIRPDCLRFFDGCNHCVRSQSGGPAACTRRACAEYAPARCLSKREATPR